MGQRIKLTFTTIIILSLFYRTTASDADMDWETFFPRLREVGKVKEAAIASSNGSILAKTSNFKITELEIKNILELFKNPQDAFTKGIVAEDRKYWTGITANFRTITGISGHLLVICARTTKVLIVANCNAMMDARTAVPEVERLADDIRQDELKLLT